MRMHTLRFRGEEIWHTEAEEALKDFEVRLRFVKECPLTILSTDARPSEFEVCEIKQQGGRG